MKSCEMDEWEVGKGSKTAGPLSNLKFHPYSHITSSNLTDRVRRVCAQTQTHCGSNESTELPGYLHFWVKFDHRNFAHTHTLLTRHPRDKIPPVACSTALNGW